MKAIRVLETNILHASDVIHWLDGTTAEEPAEMLRANVLPHLELSTAPTDLRIVNTYGKTALLRRPSNEMVDGRASAADLQRPAATPYVVAGTVSDPDGRIVPRAFSITAGNVAGHALVVYPSLLGTRFGTAGGLLGTLRFTGSGAAVPWAILTLAVTTAVDDTLTFRAQADGRGDFMLPLNRLPPLPEGIDHYAGELSIAASSDAEAATPVDPDELSTAMELGDLDANTFAVAIVVNVVPGEIRLIRSSNRNHLAVQPG